MSLHDPKTGIRALAFNAILIAFFSASQDIAGDAYRTDVLEDREMGAGRRDLGARLSCRTARYRLVVVRAGGATLVGSRLRAAVSADARRHCRHVPRAGAGAARGAAKNAWRSSRDAVSRFLPARRCSSRNHRAALHRPLQVFRCARGQHDDSVPPQDGIHADRGWCRVWRSRIDRYDPRVDCRRRDDRAHRNQQVALGVRGVSGDEQSRRITVSHSPDGITATWCLRSSSRTSEWDW